MTRPTTTQVIVDQCRLGLKTKEGLPAMKPTVLVSNSEILLEPFQNLRCKGNHVHGHLVGGRAAAAQVWTWDFANRLVEGVIRLKRHLNKVWYEVAYPSVGSGPGDPDAPRPEVYKWKCQACRHMRSKHDPRHTRIPGECSREHDEPIEYDCPGCKAFKPAGHGMHVDDAARCKWAMVPRRRAHMRQGRHPRHGRIPATGSETTDAQAQLPDGEDLGQYEERDLFPPDQGDSSGSAARPAPEDGDQPAEAPVAGTRAPHTRNRRKFADTGVGTEKRSDWTRFEIGSVLRVLKMAQEKSVIQRELRKLHLRWWHAPKTSMVRVLEAAGLPKDVLNMVPDIVETCRECRKWQKPAHDTVATIKMSTKFNQHVEMDLMFYKSYIVCHFIDRASRWHAAKMVENKEDGTLVDALMTTWISVHGPMEELIVDGESGVVKSEVFAGELKARGIKLKPRAPQQHARYIERRGAILRHSMHVIEDQMKHEGLSVTMNVLLAEAVFAGNCLTYVGGVTPYQVVYGRQPAILPPMSIDEQDLEQEGIANDRVEARTREIACLLNTSEASDEEKDVDRGGAVTV